MSKDKNDDRDISTWTCDYSRQFLERHGSQQGNKAELKEICVLLKHLIANVQENLFTLSKIELRCMCTDLKKCVRFYTKNIGDATSDMLESIEEEEGEYDVVYWGFPFNRFCVARVFYMSGTVAT